MLDNEKIEQLKAQHPGVELFNYSFELTDDEGKPEPVDIVCRAPGPEDLEFMLAKAAARLYLSSSKAIILKLLVYPAQAEVEKLFERKPLLPQMIGNQIQDEAGLNVEVLKKRL